MNESIISEFRNCDPERLAKIAEETLDYCDATMTDISKFESLNSDLDRSDDDQVKAGEVIQKNLTDLRTAVAKLRSYAEDFAVLAKELIKAHDEGQDAIDRINRR